MDDGRTILVTGATSGIGRVAAERIAAAGGKTLLVARNKAKGEEAVSEIRSATGNDDVHLILGDLSSLDAVRSVAARTQELTDRLDVLVNNAGLLVAKREVTTDGFEHTIAVNHLAPFLLTHLLLDLLRAAPAPRVVTTASSAHQMGELDLDDLHWEKRHYTQFRGYCASKLANIHFAAESARRWPDIHSISVHPGSIRTSFGHEGSFWLRNGIRYSSWLVQRPVEVGAIGLVWGALDDGAAQVPNGAYTFKCQTKKPARRGRDAVKAAGLWDASVRLTGLG